MCIATKTFSVATKIFLFSYMVAEVFFREKYEYRVCNLFLYYLCTVTWHAFKRKLWMIPWPSSAPALYILRTGIRKKRNAHRLRHPTKLQWKKLANTQWLNNTVTSANWDILNLSWLSSICSLIQRGVLGVAGIFLPDRRHLQLTSVHIWPTTHNYFYVAKTLLFLLECGKKWFDKKTKENTVRRPCQTYGRKTS
jgi:hypothetical protein